MIDKQKIEIYDLNKQINRLNELQKQSNMKIIEEKRQRDREINNLRDEIDNSIEKILKIENSLNNY